MNEQLVIAFDLTVGGVGDKLAAGTPLTEFQDRPWCTQQMIDEWIQVGFLIDPTAVVEPVEPDIEPVDDQPDDSDDDLPPLLISNAATTLLTENGIDPAELKDANVVGTGTGGMITITDVKTALDL